MDDCLCFELSNIKTSHQVELRNPRRQPADVPLVEEEEKEIEVGAAIERKRPMTKEDIQKMNLKKKTRKRTRKFEIDGVTVTTTTSKVIYRDEESETFYDEHYFRKQVNPSHTFYSCSTVILFRSCAT